MDTETSALLPIANLRPAASLILLTNGLWSLSASIMVLSTENQKYYFQRDASKSYSNSPKAQSNQQQFKPLANLQNNTLFRGPGGEHSPAKGGSVEPPPEKGLFKLTVKCIVQKLEATWNCQTCTYLGNNYPLLINSVRDSSPADPVARGRMSIKEGEV